MASLSKCVDLATRFTEEDVDELVQEMVLVREDMDVDDNVAALEAATRIVERSQTMRDAITDKTGPIVNKGVQIKEVADGFEAYLDGEKVGRLKDTLARGQAALLDEPATIDIVKVDDKARGKGVGSALYKAFFDKHEGRVAPSGKTTADAWRVWKRNYPDKVDEFVAQEQARIAEGADPQIVAGNITDAEIKSRVLGTRRSAARDLFPGDFASKSTTVTRERLLSSKGPEKVRLGNVDSGGKRITATKQGLERFYDWFGESAATDDKGRPLVLYHATNADVEAFETNRKTSNNYGLLGDIETRRAGIFMTPDRTFAQEYLREGPGQNVMRVYASLQNPLDLRDGVSESVERELEAAGISERYVRNIQNTWELFDSNDEGKNDFVDSLIAAGYDGAIFREGSPSREPGGGATYVAFKPEQIKSAIGNRGTFDPSNPDIRRSPARDQTETPEFKKWFGDSKVVDADGKPLAVYHGTASDFSVFDPAKSAESLYGAGFYFSPREKTAREWGSRKVELPARKPGQYLDPMAALAAAETAARVMPVYLRIVNPASGQEARDAVRQAKRELDDLDLTAEVSARAQQILSAEGYDGVDVDGYDYVAFRPEQIKSAIGNDGSFDPSNPDIRRSPPRWQMPEPTRLDDFIRKMQDKQIDTKRVVASIKQTISGINEAFNPYLQEELYHGRAAKATKDFLDLEMRPLLQDMQARGLTIEETEKYLHNLHAEERNAQIAKVNPAMPDGGSGIDTADAKAYLAGLSASKRAALAAIAKRVEALNRKTQKMLVDSGLEKQSTIDAWNAAYKHYVPLQREEFADDALGGTGQGFSVRGAASKRAMGSSKEVSNILGNLSLARERTITRAEKNRVSTALYGLAIQAPGTDFWYAFAPERAKITPKLEAELVAMGMNPIDVQSILAEPTQQYIDPRTGLVTTRVNPLMRSAPNVVALRVNGEDRFVLFNDRNERAQRMSAALKNLDADQLGEVLGLAAKVSRWFASVNTQYNPVFGIVNGLRDVQSALFNLSTTKIAGQQAAVTMNAMSAVRGIYSDIRAHRKGNVPQSKWAQLYEEFQREGGQTGFRDMFKSSNERAEAIEDEFKKLTEGKAKAVGRAVFGWLSDYNETIENATRLAAYKVGLDQGLSKQEAASIAKNLTVNFNRKGQAALQAGALYAFFNASVQGTARLAETLRGPAGRKIALGGLLLGVLQALALSAAGFGDDEPPEFVKERSLVIPTGDGKYLSMPMPLGFHVLPSISRIATEWALNGFREPAKRLVDLLSLFADTFNPIGNAGISMQTVAPTALDPLAALLENRDYTGKPIAREDMNPLKPTPGYLRAKDTASELSKQLSYYLNLASGGTKYQPGAISPTPDQIDYLIGQVTGGVGREVLKAEQTVTSARTGEELPPNKVPLLGRFYGDTTGQASHAAKFYSGLKKVNAAVAEVDGRRENKELEGLQEYRLEHPELRLEHAAKKASKELTELKAKKRELLEKDATPERIRLVEERITLVMKRFNERMARLEDQRP